MFFALGPARSDRFVWSLTNKPLLKLRPGVVRASSAQIIENPFMGNVQELDFHDFGLLEKTHQEAFNKKVLDWCGIPHVLKALAANYSIPIGTIQ